MENTLGQYKIMREIGKGGMGIIYKALDPRTQKPVAIKVLPPTMVDRVTVERFHREVQAMVKLKHPNMIEVYDSGMEKGKHFLVMEFVEGENLKTVIKNQGALAAKRALQVTAQIADALSHVHKQGMIHRDIKPANIMITPDGKVKVMDYGLVKMLGVTNVTVDGTSLGTAEYMSPEQISGDGVDSRTDIYSLGIALYEMLTGRLPFEGDSMQALLMKHKNEIPVPVRKHRPEVPVEAEWIVTKAMAKDLSSRYQTVEMLLADLLKLTGPLPAAGQGKTASASRTTERKIKVNKLVLEKKSTERRFSHNYFGAGIFLFMVIWIAAVIIYRDKVFTLIKEKPWTKVMVFPQRTDLLGEAERSLRVLEKAEKHFDQGQEYARQGSAAKAAAEFQAAIKLRNDHPPYYRALALVYEEQNEHKKAVKAWTDLIRYSSDGAEVEEAQKHIQELAEK